MSLQYFVHKTLPSESFQIQRFFNDFAALIFSEKAHKRQRVYHHREWNHIKRFFYHNFFRLNKEGGSKLDPMYFAPPRLVYTILF